MAQHISIRTPWKDNGYSGQICDKPCFNTSCMILKNIAENKDDAKEGGLAGQSIKGHELEIPCLSEGGCFMSEQTFLKTIHPYKKQSENSWALFRDRVDLSSFFSSCSSIRVDDVKKKRCF